MKVENLFKYALAMVSGLVPRNRHLWVTGKNTVWEYDNAPPQFFDNSKYFYLYLVEKTDEKVYWLSDSESEYAYLKEHNLPVVKLKSLRGMWLTLRAKYTFHHYGPNQIDRILQYGAVQIDFWHGTPLKKIRYDVTPKPQVKLNPLASFLNRKGYEYISSTSEFLSDHILKGAFAAKDDQMINFGYPRLDVLKYGKDEIVAFCKKYSENLLPYIDLVKNKKVLLYMPTWRDDDPEYFSKAKIDFERLNKELEDNNYVMFLKMHPLTINPNIGEYRNIVQISNDTDIYPFLTYVDYLITDYSSIYFDFLTLDREIIFVPYDFASYVASRELYFDYDDMTPGIKYLSFNEFIDNVSNFKKLDYAKERKRVVEMLIENYNFDACQKTYEFFAKN